MTLPPVFIATGAYSVGKTTTLRWLSEHRGVTVHAEAHPQAVAALGERSLGHPPGQPFSRIDDPAHFCPACHPRAFCDQVVALQHRIEAAASPWDLLERGVYDPVEFCLRLGGAPASAIEDEACLDPAWRPLRPYARVFLFEVMPELQQPKWGRTADARVAEALMIEGRLERIYATRGYDIVRIAPGRVEERAARVLDVIAGTRA